MANNAHFQSIMTKLHPDLNADAIGGFKVNHSQYNLHLLGDYIVKAWIESTGNTYPVLDEKGILPIKTVADVEKQINAIAAKDGITLNQFFDELKKVKLPELKPEDGKTSIIPANVKDFAAFADHTIHGVKDGKINLDGTTYLGHLSGQFSQYVEMFSQELKGKAHKRGDIPGSDEIRKAVAPLLKEGARIETAEHVDSQSLPGKAGGHSIA